MEDHNAWQRSFTGSGIPYYINHETEKTFWNHPLTMKMERKVFSFGKIKYAAYRTALKLRAIQKGTCGCNLKLSNVKEFFELNGMEHSADLKEIVSATELMRILKELFLFEIKSGGSIPIDPLLASELMLNWLLNVHDSSRKGVMRLLSVKISLVIICSGSPRQKYHYLFSQLKDQHGFVNEERIGFFIQACLKIPKYLKEQSSFGIASIQPAVKNFLKQATNQNEGLCDDFVEWMLAEPQPLVWIPTLYRLAASETVKHECKCNICKQFPLVGFRYKCLQCFNYDLCQECFWTGRASKSHKLEHPTQEYCLPSSQTSDLKDAKKMFKNKLFKSKKNKNKQASKKRYTEIPPDQQSVASGVKDYEGIGDDENEMYSEPSNYQVGSEYSEDASSVIQNNKSVEEIIQNNTWEPETQPLQRPQSMESLPQESASEEPPNLNYTEVTHADKIQPLSSDQRDELDRVIASIEADNRDLQHQIEQIRDSQDQEDRRQTMLMSENARLKLEKRRAEERQSILEEHNRLLEMEMQKMRLLLQQKQPVLALPSVRHNTNLNNSNTKRGTAVGSDINTLAAPSNEQPLVQYQSSSNSNVIRATSNPNSKLRIPTLMLIKNSRITPIYEEIPDDFNLRRPSPRRNAWETERQELGAYDTLFDRDKSAVSVAPLYEEIPDLWDGRFNTPTRETRFLRERGKSPEEQTLDQTVKWAMDNFVFSETESNC